MARSTTPAVSAVPDDVIESDEPDLDLMRWEQRDSGGIDFDEGDPDR